jgi:tetratricopeptide (TPR) repeat protein
MEKLARETDNLQDIIDVKSKDLSCEFSYLKIAEECRKAGEYQLAMKWAETGLKEFKNKCDERLLDFLANEYQRIKRHDDAIRLHGGFLSKHHTYPATRNLLSMRKNRNVSKSGDAKLLTE